MIPLLLLALGAGALLVAASSGGDSVDELGFNARTAPPKGLPPAQAQAKLAEIRAIPNPTFMGVFGNQREGMKRRRHELMRWFPDAEPLAADKYSGGTFLVDNFAVDEFGRYYKGVPWDPGGFALDVTAQVLPYLPLPPGTKAALSIVIAIGRGEAIDNAALQALESELPPAARIGVHIAAGLYAGESLDESTLDAVWNEYPEAKQAYDQASSILKSQEGG